MLRHNPVPPLSYATIFVKDSVATVSVDSDLADVLVTQWTNNGESKNCTPDKDNSKITITKTGTYYIDFHASVDLDSGVTVTLHLEGYLGGVVMPQIHSHRTVTAVGKGSMSSGAFVNIATVPVDLDIRANIDNATARDLTVEDAQLNVNRVGPAS